MASINQMIAAAEAAGFERTECAHDTPQHIVLDYPKPFEDRQVTRFWRIHTDMSKVPHVTYIGGTGLPDQRVTLKAAIDFAQRVAAEHPKES